MNGFSNRPKILKGAFVEYGLSIPPLIVCFQFNPETIKRNRSLSVSVPGESQKKTDVTPLREYHQREEFKSLIHLRDTQDVSVHSETISFELRLDATDKLNDGNPIAEQLGITPQLSTLEQMMVPKGERGESIIREIVSKHFSRYSFTGKENPPVILFVWGRKRVLPVNITSMNITEEEFSTNLNPVRATISVDMTVIEGPNPVYKSYQAIEETMSGLNLANLVDKANTIVPL